MVLIHDVDPSCFSCIWAFKNATQLGFRDSVERANSLLRLPALSWRGASSTLVEFARKLVQEHLTHVTIRMCWLTRLIIFAPFL